MNPTNLPEPPKPEVKHPILNNFAKFGFSAVAIAIARATILLLMPRLLHPSRPLPDLPILQSIQAKPNLVKKGDVVTILVVIDRPAPKNGIKIDLSSSDPSVLTVDGSATLYHDDTFGTAYSRAVAVPGYLSPIQIVATYNGETVRTPVSVIGQGAHPAEQATTSNQTQSEVATQIAKPSIDQPAQTLQVQPTLQLGDAKGTNEIPLKDCTLSGELVAKNAKARLISRNSGIFVQAFIEVENSSQIPVSFIQIGPAEFTDFANRQTESSTTTAPFSKVLPGPGGSAIVFVANQSERVEPGRTGSFRLDFPVAPGTKMQNGELTFKLATFVGPNVSGAGFATRSQSHSVHCVNK